MCAAVVVFVLQVRCVVVGNPANTNARVLALHAAPAVAPRQITALTRLDHNRARAALAARVGVRPDAVRGVCVWGNHSSTQYPDAAHATVAVAGGADAADGGGAPVEVAAARLVDDDSWLEVRGGV